MQLADPIPSFVDGDLIPLGAVAKDFVRPADGARVGQILEAGEKGVALAVAAASGAFRALQHNPVHKRVELLQAAAHALEGAIEEVAEIICNDVGKPMRIARFEVKRGVEFTRNCAAVVSQLGGEILPLDAAANAADCIGMVRRVPYGVVAAITPFNAPVNLLLQKVAPAIAAGNAIVVKPAIPGLRTASRIAALFSAAGWPKGLFNVVSGDRETAAALVRHSDVRAVTFTGGTAGGDALARLAGAKKFVAELGSNAANIVFADADLSAAATKIASAGFEASGQQCISAQRILVEHSVHDAFVEALVGATQKLKVGPADDPATDIGPMVDEASAARVMDMFKDALARGGKAILIPERKGALVSPAILAEVPRDARLWREEAFGPIVVIVDFKSTDEAIALANDSAFGLQGAVFTSNLSTALRVARDFDVGSLWINEASRFRLDSYPFGGVKNSGFGREGLRYAIEELSQLKFIGIRP
jgi:acyl-CoA reductase-like NAD-dependent aldehyde dehydrogenase